MRALEEIRSLFEHRSYRTRIRFINEYDFKDDHFDYYYQFILANHRKIKDHVYLSDLIMLAGSLGMYDDKLRKSLFAQLFTPVHYVVKLAILDYFSHCNREILGPSYEMKLNGLWKKDKSILVRHQVLFNLILLGAKQKQKYIDALKASLDRTNDWRPFYRMLKSVEYSDLGRADAASICNFIEEQCEKKDLGKDVKWLVRQL